MKIKCCIVGTRYANGFECLDEHKEVKLVLEPENTYSRYAIRVETEGGLKIGMVGENYIPKPLKAHRYDLNSSKTICKFLEQGYKIIKTVVDLIVKDTAILEVEMEFIGVVSEETTSEEVISPMEEENMVEKKISVVGISHHAGEVAEGDLVSFRVYKGNSTLYNVQGESIGVLPQSDRKIKELEAINAPILKNRDAKEANTIYDKPYVVYGIIEGKYVFVREMNEEDLVQATNNDPEVVVEEMDELSMFDIIAIATTKMHELLTLYECETISEEVVEEKTTNEVVTEVTTEVKTVAKGESMLKSRIIATRASIDAKEKELNQLKADLEMYETELANVEHRNALISEIKEYIFGLETRDIERIHEIVMNDVQSSSIEEESASEELSFSEWKAYVEDYWRKGFDSLRNEEESLGFNDFKAIDEFVQKVKRFNKQLKQFKSEGYDEILTLYWIKNMHLLKVVCNAYELTSHRLTNSCIMDDNDLSFFLEG